MAGYQSSTYVWMSSLKLLFTQWSLHQILLPEPHVGDKTYGFTRCLAPKNGGAFAILACFLGFLSIWG